MLHSCLHSSVHCVVLRGSTDADGRVINSGASVSITNNKITTVKLFSWHCDGPLVCYNVPWFFFKISALYKSFTYLLTYLHIPPLAEIFSSKACEVDVARLVEKKRNFASLTCICCPQWGCNQWCFNKVFGIRKLQPLYSHVLVVWG